MRKCIGLTARAQKCRRPVSGWKLVCHQHRLQPLLLVLLLIGLFADFQAIGLFIRDLVLEEETKEPRQLTSEISGSISLGAAIPEGASEAADRTASRSQQPLPNYRIEGPGDTLRVRPLHHYLEAYRHGVLEGVFLDHGLVGKEWSFPELEVKLLNRGTLPVSIGSLELHVASYRVDTDPVLVFGEYGYRSVEIFNEGWGPAIDPKIEYSLAIMAGPSAAGSDDPAPPFADDRFTFEASLPDIETRVLVNLSPDLPAFLSPSAKGTVRVEGRVSYRTLDQELKVVRFRTRADLSGSLAGDALARSATYDVFVSSDGPTPYSVPIAHVVAPGEADRIGLTIATPESAYLTGTLIARSFSGEELMRREIDLKTFVPRSFVRQCIKNISPFAWCKASESDTQSLVSSLQVPGRQSRLLDDTPLFPDRPRLVVRARIDLLDDAMYLYPQIGDLFSDVSFAESNSSQPQSYIQFSEDTRSFAVALQHRLVPLEFALAYRPSQSGRSSLLPTEIYDPVILHLEQSIDQILILYSPGHRKYSEIIAGLLEGLQVVRSPDDQNMLRLSPYTLYVKKGHSASPLLDPVIKRYLLKTAEFDPNDRPFLAQFDAVIALTVEPAAQPSTATPPISSPTPRRPGANHNDG